jgi:hypothetical protein
MNVRLSGAAREGRTPCVRTLASSAVVWLQGGLGNQLFQFAAALDQSRHGLPVRFSRRAFLRDPHRSYALAPLMPHRLVLPVRCELFLPHPYGRLPFRRRVDAHDGSQRRSWLPGTTVVGYFQGEEHFRHVIEPLRHALREVLAARNTPSATSSTPRIAVHVRRGDYVSNATAASTLGVRTASYYQRGIGVLRDAIPDAEVVAFTDDPAWVRQELRSDVDRVIGPAEESDEWNVLAGLASAQGIVISNSSFSWWAAWTADLDPGLTVAPLRWFADGRSGAALRVAGWRYLGD